MNKNASKISYWLLKTEPEEFSYSDLEKKKSAYWDGVRNYQARNFLLKMKLGDLAFIYHTGKERAVIGIAEVTKEAVPEKTPDKGDWVHIEVKPKLKLNEALNLSSIKSIPSLKELPLLKQSRLSVMPIQPNEFTKILSLTKTHLDLQEVFLR